MISVSSPRGPHLGTKIQSHPTAYRLQSWNASDQTTRKTGTQPHPSADTLPKVVLSSQLPQNTPLDMALTIRGTRPSSTHQRAGTSPCHQEACTSTWNNFMHQGWTQEARGTTILQLVERRPQTQKVRQNETTEKYVASEGIR